jgi:dTDP-4-dehydrorhamnose 3,5-epimerase
MKFTSLPLAGAFLIAPEPREDARGFFARAFCREEFAQHGLNPHLEQCNISFNWKKGTLRGMHYQTAPYAEVKLVRCTRGAIYDVIVDIRPHSSTFKKWAGFELTAENRQMLYVPEGFAHGYQTLEDSSEVFYQVSASYAPQHAKEVRWNDPAFGIRWPVEVTAISEKDKNCSDFCL